MECPNCGEDMMKQVYNDGNAPMDTRFIYYVCIYCGCVVDKNGEKS